MVSVWVSGSGGTYLERGCVEGGTYLERGCVEGGTYLERRCVEGGRDASHRGWTVAWQVGKWRGQGHSQEGGWDMSHSGWTAAWCLTMSKSRCEVFLFRLMHFFLGLLTQPGGCVWVTPHQKNCRPAHLCLTVTAVSTASMSRHPWPPCLCACVWTPTTHLLCHPRIQANRPTDGDMQ